MQIRASRSFNKTVFVLGAGFSKEAGAPSQEELVKKIFEMSGQRPYEYTDGFVDEFRRILTEVLDIPIKLHEKVPLEDIFTPLDKCLNDGVSFRGLSVDKIIETRSLIYYLIGKTIQIILQERSHEKQYIDAYANWLVCKSAARGNKSYKEHDPVSVLSTNWDIVLDNSIQNSINHHYQGNAVVDYCCHISSYEESNNQILPGLEMLGKGGFNVKLLKLHGSLNWLQCPRCQRLYVDFYNKIAIRQYEIKEKCRHCNRNFGVQESHILSSNMVMPTFLKNLTNPQYRLIWQNAGIELSEADRIVFIGYSLPTADFEMRQLLSRMVRSNARIELVTYGIDGEQQLEDTKTRYNVFFGNRLKRIHINGAKHYIQKSLLLEEPLT